MMARTAVSIVMPGSWIRRCDEVLRADVRGRVVGVDDHEVVAVAHGGQQPEQVGRQDRIDRFQHVTAVPLIDRSP
ncbi:DNA integrity scanning protein DisA with diadenylate cyclase activity [Bradyrhizobium ottawaense]